jgi:hypothetical protein
MTTVIEVDGKIRLDSSDVEKGAKKAEKSLLNIGKVANPNLAALGLTVGSVGLALGTVAKAAEMAYSTIKEGAALELARSRFDNLTASIGTTADSLLGKLREATGGMISDAELIASATDMMNLGFAKTEDQAVRLTSVAGQLGWNMQQLTLTLANQSTMRLDALGLSVEEVTGRFKELKASGMAAQDAFQMAVIEAGEKKLELLGSAAETSAGKLQKFEAGWANSTNAMKIAAVQLADNIGLIESLSNVTSGLARSTGFSDELDRALQNRIITLERYEELRNTSRGSNINHRTGEIIDVGAFDQLDLLYKLKEALDNAAISRERYNELVEASATAEGYKAAQLEVDTLIILKAALDEAAISQERYNELVLMAQGGNTEGATRQLELQTQINKLYENGAISLAAYIRMTAGLKTNTAAVAAEVSGYTSQLRGNAEEMAHLGGETHKAAGEIWDWREYVGQTAEETRAFEAALADAAFAQEVVAARARMAAEAVTALSVAFNSISADYMNDLPGADDPLVTPERQVSFVVAGPTNDQTALLQEYQDLYDKAADKVRDLTNGIGTFGMEQDKVNDALEEANAEMAYYGGLMEPLRSIPTEVGTAQQGMTVNVNAARTALFEQAQAAGANAPALVALGVATGQMTEAQGEAALKAAALFARIQELGVLIAGGMSIDVAMNLLDSFIAQMNGEFIPTTGDIPPAMADAKEAVGEFGDSANDAEEDTRGLKEAVDEYNGTEATAYLYLDDDKAWTDLDTLNAALEAYGHSSYTAYLDTVVNPPNNNGGGGGGGGGGTGDDPDPVRDDRSVGGGKGGAKSPIAQYRELGRALGAAMVGGIERELVDGQNTVAKQIVALGNSASRLFNSFMSAMPDLSPDIDKASDALQTAVDALAPFWSDTVIDNINDMDPAQAAEALRNLRARSVYQNNPEAKRRLEEAIRLADERNRLEAEYAEQQKKILEYQERQAQLSFLQTQLELLQLIRDNGLDANILAGLTLGLDADMDSLMAVMMEVMQSIIGAAEEELGIHSPSTVFAEIGHQMMAGLEKGIRGGGDMASMFLGKDLYRSADMLRAAVANNYNNRNLYIYGGVSVHRDTPFSSFIEELYGVSQ